MHSELLFFKGTVPRDFTESVQIGEADVETEDDNSGKSICFNLRNEFSDISHLDRVHVHIF